MEYKLLIIKNRYTKKLDFKKGLDWFSKNTPLIIKVEEIETDFDLEFDRVGNASFTGFVPKITAQLKTVVPAQKYHAVCLVYGNDAPGVRVSIAYDTPLYPDTEICSIAVLTDKGKVLNHELIHLFFKRLWRQGIKLQDPMDTYLNDGNLDAKSSNRTMSLELLKPYWNKIPTFNNFVQNIVHKIVTPTPKVQEFTKTKYKYFTEEEVKGLKPELVQKLDEAREYAGVPFTITSGFRTPEENKRVGGEANSAHLRGFAADIRAVGSTNYKKIVDAGIKAGFERIGFMKGAIHFDCDPTLPKGYWGYEL